MNLALGAILLAILLIPPLIALFCYTKGTHGRGMPKLTLLEYLLLSATLSLLFHGIAIKICHREIDYEFMFRLLAGQMNEEYVRENKINFERYFFHFSQYIIVVSAVSFFLGMLFKWVTTRRWLRMSNWLQRYRRDQKPSSLFSYFNNWWYFFRVNEYSRKYQYLGKERPLIRLSALVETKEITIIYTGVLLDFVLKGNELDFIYLDSPTKKGFTRKNESGELEIDEDIDEKLIMPEGGILAISYPQIKNMYIRFISLEANVTEKQKKLISKANVNLLKVEETDNSGSEPKKK